MPDYSTDCTILLWLFILFTDFFICLHFTSLSYVPAQVVSSLATSVAPCHADDEGSKIL
jgi:hypothetical protein